MPKLKFGDIVQNITQKATPKPGDERFYIGLEHLDSGSLKVSRWGSKVAITGDKLLMRKGDILFGRRNTYLRRVAIAPHDGLFSAHGMIFRAKENVINKDFLPFFIASDAFMDEAIRISVGSLSPTVNWKELKELEFDIPTLEDQKRLTELLVAINELKEKYLDLIAISDELVKSQFIEMTQGVDTTSLSDICCSYGRGKTPKYVTSSNVRVINQACIYWDHFKLQNVKYHNPDFFKEENKLILGDVLLNSTGTGTIGRAIVFDIEDENDYMTDSHVTILRPNNKKIHPVVLKYYFYDDNVQSELYRLCVFGSTSQAELSREALGRMRVPVVDYRKQEAFVEVVKQTDKSKFEAKKAIEELNSLQKKILLNVFGEQ